MRKEKGWIRFGDTGRKSDVLTALAIGTYIVQHMVPDARTLLAFSLRLKVGEPLSTSWWPELQEYEDAYDQEFVGMLGAYRPMCEALMCNLELSICSDPHLVFQRSVLEAGGALWPPLQDLKVPRDIELPVWPPIYPTFKKRLDAACAASLPTLNWVEPQIGITLELLANMFDQPNTTAMAPPQQLVVEAARLGRASSMVKFDDGRGFFKHALVYAAMMHYANRRVLLIYNEELHALMCFLHDAHEFDNRFPLFSLLHAIELAMSWSAQNHQETA